MPAQQASHPSADRLVAFRTGKLSTEDSAAIQQHINACKTCHAVLQALQQARPTLFEQDRPSTVDVPPPENASAGAGSAAPDPGSAGPAGPPAPAAQAAAPPAGSAGGAGLAVSSRFGRYQILKCLGRGGMGSVYLAEDTQLGRRVALKVPHFTAEHGPRVLERFYREARAAATLEHANLCPVYDVGQVEGTHYLTMAYVEGRPLADFIQPDKPLPERQVAAVVRKLALAMQEAHARGVVHRDLKPANILINRRREPVIMDFGLARLSQQENARLTRVGAIMGTPSYMAPEQVKGDVQAMGPGCDVYSLGVILYEMLTGRLPFEGPITSVLGQILVAEARPPSAHRPDLDRGLEAICQKAMAKKVEERYASMADFAAALTQFLRSEAAPPPAAAAETRDAAPAPTQDPKGSLAAELFAGISTARDVEPPPSRPAPRKRRRKRRKADFSWVSFVAAVGLILVIGLVLVGIVRNVRPTYGTVILEVDQPGAEVAIEPDEIVTQVSDDLQPIRRDLPPGSYQLRVFKVMFHPHTRKFTVKAGARETIRVRLEPIKPVPQSSSLGAVPQHADQGARQEPGKPALPSRSLAFEHSLSKTDTLQQLTCSFGQYGGGAEVMPGKGLRMGGGHTPGVVWAKPFLGQQYRVQFEVQLQKDGPGASWLLNGPGYGNSLNTGYWCKVDKTTVKLWREGEEKHTATLYPPIAPGVWATVRIDVDGGKIVANVNGQPLSHFEDAQPLVGPLHGWFGMSGDPGGEVFFRNLRLWSAAKDTDRALQLTPPATVKPVANGKLLYELKPATKALGSEWFESQPHAVRVENGTLVLGDAANAWPALVLTKPLPSDLACEVEFEYPNYEAVNFWIMLWSAREAPQSARDCDGGWLVALPGGGGVSGVTWHRGPDAETVAWDTLGSRSPSVASQPYYSPISGRKYLTRLEARGDEVRVFLDGGLLVRARKPPGTPPGVTPVFLGLKQCYSRSKVHALRVYQIATEKNAGP
jgi:hypothetical protein